MTSLQPDSEPILENGTGTPYLAIFDSTGSPIKDTYKNLPLGMFVTSFEYNYIEEDVDEGEFVIETDNTEIPSLPSLQYNEIILLQWGYIFPHKEPLIGPVRKVMVISNEITFSPNGVKMKVEFADPNVLSKNIPANYKSTNDDWDEFSSIFSDICKGYAGNTMRISDYKGGGTTQQEVILRVNTEEPIPETDNGE